MMPDHETSWLEWGIAARPIPGEVTSGDQHLVVVLPDRALIAVLDGLGHGEEAAEASHRAIEVLEQDPEAPVDTLMRRCHEALVGTRGATVTLVSWQHEPSAITWLAVGNVEAFRVNRESGHRESIMNRPGVVGDRLPTLRASSVNLGPDDLLVLATDGIRSAFSEKLTRLGEGGPQEIADFLLEEFARGTDDALVLVARARESEP